MSEERLQDFAHLIEVLRAGCPPHAGMALGFDRLIAVMLGKESVRDVIAFPKSGKGEEAGGGRGGKGEREPSLKRMEVETKSRHEPHIQVRQAPSPDGGGTDGSQDGCNQFQGP